MQMNKLEPRTSVPIVWALTEVLGLSVRQIRERAGVSTFTLHQMLAGTTSGRAHLASLATLARKVLDEIGADAAENITMGKDYFKSYRQAAYAVVRRAIDGALVDAVRYEPGDEQPRETDLSLAILQHLPAKGALRRDVVHALKPLYRPAAIQRCARRIGVIEKQTNKGRWWCPPPGHASIAVPPKPPRRFTPPKTRLQRKVVDRILALLAKAPDGMRPDDVIDACADLSLSRAIIYRMGRYADVRRVTTGFGPTKRTLWFHPQSSQPDTDDDAS